MIKELIDKVLWKKLWVLSSLNKHREFAKAYQEVKNETTLNMIDLFNVYSCTKAIQKLEGSIAEVGVFKGSSAKLISLFKGNKQLFCFDTFEGIPEVTEYDLKQGGGMFQKNDFSCSLEKVKSYLKDFEKISFYKGIFPKDTSQIVKNESFCFVHLDVDVYKSTKECLEFFYPRLVQGGIILSHDYPNSCGVKKAFDEFFKDKKEVLVMLLDQQAMIIKG